MRMKRRDFFKNGLLTSLGLGAMASFPAVASSTASKKTAKNIIFLVSDGMSSGTLNIADILIRHKEGKPSTWINLYEKNMVRRALMDTSSASSLITDSAAAGSAWGGGIRVRNGALNIGPNGEKPVPILQKFKSAGKSVGCVTTVQITHATPASFCVNNSSRNAMTVIAEDYLSLRFDVMMGGGAEFFSPEKRADNRDLFDAFKQTGFEVARNRTEMMNAKGDKPLLAVFSEDGLPYAVDRINNKELSDNIPSLAEMTKKAIDIMSKNPKGFVMQVEGGKVDWAAHDNDAPALLYDQLDFDAAVGVAVDFAMKDKETLVVITTDHGNANPGLFYSSKANQNLERLFETTASNEWILNQINHSFSNSQVIDLFMEYQKTPLSPEEAQTILSTYTYNEDGLYNPKNLPFHPLASIQSNYTSIQWAGTNHSADFVELAMFGPGSENLSGFMKNYELHNFLLHASRMDKTWMV
jgi:alkaline phosphatase